MSRVRLPAKKNICTHFLVNFSVTLMKCSLQPQTICLLKVYAKVSLHNVQGKELCLCTFDIGLHLDIYELISCKLSMMLDTAKLYTLI